MAGIQRALSTSSELFSFYFRMSLKFFLLVRMQFRPCIAFYQHFPVSLNCQHFIKAIFYCHFANLVC
jgi:hypothetical protein